VVAGNDPRVLTEVGRKRTWRVGVYRSGISAAAGGSCQEVGPPSTLRSTARQDDTSCRGPAKLAGPQRSFLPPTRGALTAPGSRRRHQRFLESARLAFARELNVWASLGIDNPKRVKIAAPEGHYKVPVHQHIDALSDLEPLYATVLVHSYAVVESAAAERLATPRKLGKIEEWGARILALNDRDWNHVEGRLAGAVEVAVIRNAFAHGSRSIDLQAQARLREAGAPARPVGMTLTHVEVRAFRDRLKSLLNQSGFRRPAT
jgi:hypothetical protein